MRRVHCRPVPCPSRSPRAFARSVLLPTVAFATSLASAASAQSESLDGEERAAVVDRIGGMLEGRYVFPEVALQCAEHLRALLGEGAFEDVTDPELFATRLTDALRSVGHDEHILVRLRSAPPQAAVPEAAPEHPAREWARRLERDRQRNFGFERVEHLDGNVGYLDLRSFSGARGARAVAAAAMGFLAGADALIFDLRENEGGYPDMVRFLCSWLFDEPTHLNSLYWREGDRTQEFWTLDDVPGQKMPDVPVFVLTSSRTFSGAEEFSYNLRTRERATLVGETTRGGANPGGVFPIDARFEVIIPTGRAINPVTGTNWEGTGVTPHVAVDADDALEAALDLARPAAEAHREARATRAAARWDAFDAACQEALRLDDEGQETDAARVLADGLRAARDADLLDEADVGMTGYWLLEQGRRALAIAAFTVNVDAFPDSSIAHANLGDAFMEAGDTERAIASYARAVELDPNDENARAMLDRLRDPSPPSTR